MKKKITNSLPILWKAAGALVFVFVFAINMLVFMKKDTKTNMFTLEPAKGYAQGETYPSGSLGPGDWIDSEQDDMICPQTGPYTPCGTWGGICGEYVHTFNCNTGGQQSDVCDYSYTDPPFAENCF